MKLCLHNSVMVVALSKFRGFVTCLSLWVQGLSPVPTLVEPDTNRGFSKQGRLGTLG